MALGKSRSRFAHDLLKHILNTEKDPQVLQAALGALSQKDSTSRTWLLAFLKRTDLAYRTHAVALESLGSQRNKDDISFLIDVTKNKELMGQHSIIRSGAFRALGKIGHLDALDYLLDQLESGQQPERARIAIVDGLVSLYDWIGERHKKRVREALCGLLKEESIFIRFSVVWGLFDLESKDIIPAIQQTQSQFTHQEWAFVTKKLKALKESSGDDKVVELNKRVEELEEKLRKLETLLVKE
jgi:aminopeptidase N